MSLASEAVKGLRMAGQAVKGYVTDPNTYQKLGNQIALDTALATGVSQVLPRALGAPAPNPGDVILNTALHSAISHPLGSALNAMGMPQWAASTTASTLGSAGAEYLKSKLTQPQMQGAPVTQSVPAEQQREISPELAEYMQLQRFHAELEQQRYNNQINLAAARNYQPPSTSTIVHKNPSADMSTIYNMLNPKVSY